jgi:hypothetical protein
MKRRAAISYAAAAMLMPALADMVTAHAAPAAYDTPSSYAWSLPVTVATDSGVHSLRLPTAVYLHAQSAGLADIRLFDRRGVPVAHALRQPPTDTYTDRKELPVRIFPLPRSDSVPVSGPTSGPTAAAGGDFKLELRTDSEGRLLSVTSGAPHIRSPSPAQASPVDTLILDLGIPARANPPGITALRFAPPAGKTSYTAQVWLEASNDLRHWQALGAADLQWLAATDGAQLACDVLAFEPAQFRYARLTWRGGTPALFSAITAVAVDTRQTAPAMDSAVLAPAPGRVPGDLVYGAGIGIPVERAAMQFTAQNAVYAAMLGSYRDVAPPTPVRQERRHHHLRAHLHRHRYEYAADPAPASPPDPFVPVASATFYDITQDGKRRRSGGLQLAPTRLAQWVVRPYSPQNAALPLAQAPRLQLSWTPVTLLFLANGNGPYTLAFGRTGARDVEQDIGYIAPGYTEEELRALPKAEAGPARQAVAGVMGVAGTAGLAGAAGAPSGNKPAAAPAASAPPGKSAIPSGSGMLWAVLLAGVAVLAYLTTRLLKQPGNTGTS